MASIEVKQISSLCKTCMRVTLSYKKGIHAYLNKDPCMYSNWPVYTDVGCLPCDRSTAHSAQWQDLELIFRRPSQHGKRCTRRERVVFASLRPSEKFMRACMRPTEAACCRYLKVCTTCILHMQLASVSYTLYSRHAKRCVRYVHIRKHWLRIFRTRKRWHACLSYTRMKSVLLLWTSSLNDRSKC